jgi:hypothetical protein
MWFVVCVVLLTRLKNTNETDQSYSDCQDSGSKYIAGLLVLVPGTLASGLATTYGRRSNYGPTLRLDSEKPIGSYCTFATVDLL